jgi:lipoprotein-releasing system ATP-binding protein
MDDAARTRIRRIGIGFVYQFHHLLPEFSAVENVMMPQLIAGASEQAATVRARDLLGRAGTGNLGWNTGRRNCRAVSSSVWPSPAPWPTGRCCCWPTSPPAILIHPQRLNWCTTSCMRLIHEEGLGALVATHNHELANGMSRIARLEQGRIIEG